MNTNEDGSCKNLDSDQTHFQEHTVTAGKLFNRSESREHLLPNVSTDQKML